MGRRDLATVLVLLGLALGYFSLTATRTLDLRDEGYLLSRSVEVAGGAVPHRDFSDVYGPGVFALTAAALLLGDGEILAVRALVMGLKALAVVFGFAIARTFSPRWAAASAAVLAIAWFGRLSANLNTPYAALFTVPLAAAALWLLIRAIQSGAVRGFFAAGLVAGATILFKQSLGAMLAYGMLLSIAAVSMCRVSPHASDEPRAAQSASRRVLLLAVWLAAAALPLAPVLAYLSIRDYLLHFLPLHVLVVGVAAVAWRRGGPPPLFASLRRELAPFALGAVLAPLAVVLMYAAWGSTGALFYDMFGLPMSLEAYYTPANLPPATLVFSLGGALGLATGALYALGGRTAAAARAGAVGGLVLSIGLFVIPSDMPRLYTADILVWRAPFALEGALLPALLALGMLLAVLHARRGTVDLPALLPLFFVQALLCFEVFPRAGHNLWILHGALAPLLAWVLYAWVSLGWPPGEGRAAPVRRTAAVLVALFVPVWLVGPLVRTVVVPSEPPAARRAPALPRAQGLSLGVKQIKDQHIDDLEQLVRFLERAEPHTAPVLVLTNEAVVPLFSGRRALFQDHAYALFLAGWGMLSPGLGEVLDSPRLLEVLRLEPDVLVVHQPDMTAKNMRRSLPRIRKYVEENFKVVARFGVYRVLRRSDRATLPELPGASQRS